MVSSLRVAIFLCAFFANAFGAEENVFKSLFEGKFAYSNDVTFVGDAYQTDDATKGYEFASIKYATAKRFERPVFNEDFAYLIDVDRQKHGLVCVQADMKFEGMPERNLSRVEDCLFLDIYTPPLAADQNEKLPVLFWIHGGGYSFGDKDLYNATELVKAVKAIVITVNYRLSIFGFLSTEDEAATGNWALHDCKLALQWVHKHIGKIGGDNKKITIFGESAGGGMVSAMMLDQEVRDLVFSTIAMSGSIAASWGIQRDPKGHAMTVGASVNCTDTDSHKLISCLKLVPAGELLNASIKHAGLLNMRVTPSIDGILIKDKPEVLMQQEWNYKGSFVSGFLAQDSAWLLAIFFKQQYYNMTYSWLVDKGIPFVMNAMNIPGANNSETHNKLRIFYNITEDKSPIELRDSLVDMYTDVMFSYPAIKQHIYYMNNSLAKAGTQMYLISYDPKYQELGATHFFDVIALFRGDMDKIMPNAASDAITKELRHFLREIAYNGTAKIGIDRPISNEEGVIQEADYLHLDKDGKWYNEKATQADMKLIDFWDKIFASSN